MRAALFPVLSPKDNHTDNHAQLESKDAPTGVGSGTDQSLPNNTNDNDKGPVNVHGTHKRPRSRTCNTLPPPYIGLPSYSSSHSSSSSRPSLTIGRGEIAIALTCACTCIKNIAAQSKSSSPSPPLRDRKDNVTNNNNVHNDIDNVDDVVDDNHNHNKEMEKRKAGKDRQIHKHKRRRLRPDPNCQRCKFHHEWIIRYLSIKMFRITTCKRTSTCRNTNTNTCISNNNSRGIGTGACTATATSKSENHCYWTVEMIGRNRHFVWIDGTPFKSKSKSTSKDTNEEDDLLKSHSQSLPLYRGSEIVIRNPRDKTGLQRLVFRVGSISSINGDDDVNVDVNDDDDALDTEMFCGGQDRCNGKVQSIDLDVQIHVQVQGSLIYGTNAEECKSAVDLPSGSSSSASSSSSIQNSNVEQKDTQKRNISCSGSGSGSGDMNQEVDSDSVKDISIVPCSCSTGTGTRTRTKTQSHKKRVDCGDVGNHSNNDNDSDNEDNKNCNDNTSCTTPIQSDNGAAEVANQEDRDTDPIDTMGKGEGQKLSNGSACTSRQGMSLSLSLPKPSVSNRNQSEEIISIQESQDASSGDCINTDIDVDADADTNINANINMTPSKKSELQVRSEGSNGVIDLLSPEVQVEIEEHAPVRVQAQTQKQKQNDAMVDLTLDEPEKEHTQHQQGNVAVSVASAAVLAPSIYLVPRGRGMSKKRINIISLALQKNTNATVQIKFDRTDLPSFIVVDQQVEVAALRAHLGYSTIDEMSKCFTFASVHLVKPSWIDDAIASSGSSEGKDLLELVPTMDQCWFKLQAYTRKNGQKRKAAPVIASGNSNGTWLSKKRQSHQFAAEVTIPASKSPNEMIDRLYRLRNRQDAIENQSAGRISTTFQGRNLDLAQLFDTISKLYKEMPIDKQDPWRSYCYNLVAGRLRYLDFEVENNEGSLAKLSKLRGFGKTIMKHVSCEDIINDKLVQLEPANLILFIRHKKLLYSRN